jgi:transcriptional regulator with PAS, ATPase and Fis domain
MLETLQGILNCSKELNQVMKQSPTSIFVADSAGKAIRINRTFEYVAQMGRESLLGRTVNDIESDGIFKPSVCALALREKRRVAVLQQIGKTEDIAVTGVPVYNERGGLFGVATNALRLNEIDSLTSLIKGTRKQLKGKPGEEERLIAESGIMKTKLQLIELIKNADTSILLTGETGVGKGVLARYIHNSSNRAKARMVEINCGAIPEPLLESELFGYESGAFTGADKRGKPGLIEMSDKGTLFLD